ncbi:MAG: DNA-directed RNA polymerase subunit alpha [Candidatus Spechtbacterales bacterium]
MQITLPKPPKIKEHSENRAVFEIEDLYPGYGVTVGNALRRVLYSSLPGAAITKVKIKGAPHEFSTLPGVLEDVLEITLNLKQIFIKLHGDEPQSATIKVKGARKVTAADIEAPSQVEVINKDAHIATVTGRDARFEVELTIEPGLGYIPVEQQQKEGAEIGAIPLDAIFTPMRKVNFESENMRVGERTNFNRLRLEIITNGAISPQEALEYACNLLVDHFRIAGQFEKKEAKIKKSIPKSKLKSVTKKTTKSKSKVQNKK